MFAVSRARPTSSLRRTYFAAVGVVFFTLTGCETLGLKEVLGESNASALPNGPERILRLAAAAMAGGDVDSALKLYRNAVEDNPNSLAAHRGLADAYYSVSAYPEARVAYTRLGAVKGGEMEHLLGLGRISLETNDLDGAMLHFNKALERDADEARARNGLAVAYDLSGDHERAQSIYADILRQDQTNRAVANNLALSLALSGQTDRAIALLSELASGPMILPQARHNLALAYALQGDDGSAEALIRDELSPEAVAETLSFYQRLKSGADE